MKSDQTYRLRSKVLSSLYLLRISSKFDINCLNVSRSMTKHVTPSSESQMIFAVRKSSLLEMKMEEKHLVYVICMDSKCDFIYSVELTHPCNAFSPKKSPLLKIRMNFSSCVFGWRMVTRTVPFEMMKNVSPRAPCRTYYNTPNDER